MSIVEIAAVVVVVAVVEDSHWMTDEIAGMELLENTSLTLSAPKG